ncbi:MAG: YVTN family beta-propeller repeat-containing protein [Bacteroidales bacterium]
MKKLIPHMCFTLFIGVCIGFAPLQKTAKRQNDVLNVNDIISTENNTYYITEKNSKRLTQYNADFSQIINEKTFDQTPTGLTNDKRHIYVTLFDSRGELCIIDPVSLEIKKTIPTQSGTTYPIISQKKNKLYVLNQFSNTVQEIDLNKNMVTNTCQVLREPKAAAFDKEEQFLYVANFLPAQRADVDTVAACVSIIDLNNFKHKKDIQLYNGSNALRGMCSSADGNYIFVTHNLGRFQVPTNQLQQGWMNTNALSVIDTRKQELIGTVLLDDPERGAAGVWDVKATPEHIVVSHSGTHEISLIDYPSFIKKFEQSRDKDKLAYDLRFMYQIRERIPLNGNGPRKIILTKDQIIIPTYFSDHINIYDLKSKNNNTIALVENRKETPAQSGEKYFNDATHCFQNWQSCNGCHPGDARTDAMNWDLLNDGLGNAKNCKSMLYSHVTPPSMISGIRKNAEIAVRKGFTHIQFSECPEEVYECVDEYLKQLRPVPSPYLTDGKLTPKAEKGRKVFDNLGCAECHSGPYFTNGKMYRIGDDVEFENGWDTPTLIEVWRTAPYLFDGRAAELKDVFKIHKHGIKAKITDKEIDELTEYVNSL